MSQQREKYDGRAMTAAKARDRFIFMNAQDGAEMC